MEIKEVSWRGLCIHQVESHSEQRPGVNRGPPHFRQDFAVPNFDTGTREAAAEGKGKIFSAQYMLIRGHRYR